MKKRTINIKNSFLNIIYYLILIISVIVILNISLLSASEYINYVVKPGDCLSEIANLYNCDINTLVKINNIKNPNYILAGQKIKVPFNNKEKKDYKVMSRYHNQNFIWPCQGKLSSYYGWRTHPIYNERKFHTGIDIALPIASPIYAAQDGVIIFSGWQSGYGKIVKIQHRDGKITYYAHNLKLFYEKGKKVQQGKIIALSGNSGISTGPHLHFEIRINNEHVNPLKYLNKEYFKDNFRT